MAVNKNLETNERIRDAELRIIDENGEQLGIMSLREALSLATDRDLDLVKINPTAQPPVCKIMDYSKYCYDMAKKEKDARRNQKQTEIKEVWLSMTIGDHDLEVKAKQANKFLDDGNKVRASIVMKGRQVIHPEFGVTVMDKFFTLTQEFGTKDEKGVTREGRKIILTLLPIKKK